MAEHTTRLAPSPTGALHLGNARTFLLNWLLARQAGWRVRFRMEDLDTPRTKPGADRQAIDDLVWLGLDWDGPVLYQSTRDDAHRRAMQTLIDVGAAYPCICSRKDVQAAASAPQEGDPHDRQVTYPGTCRGRFTSAEIARAEAGRDPAWRVRVDQAAIAFDDGFAGPQRFELSRTCGDFVIFRNEGLIGYQLAVVVDDHDAGVDCIVRGDDLLDSTARQIHLRRLLGYDDAERYWHVPLVRGADGLRLAKRHGDTRISTYRNSNVTRQRMLGLLAWWCGQITTREEIDLPELLQRFDITLVAKNDITFTAEDDAWLRGEV